MTSEKGNKQCVKRSIPRRLRTAAGNFENNREYNVKKQSVGTGEKKKGQEPQMYGGWRGWRS